jgi:hypothetical protein
MDAVAYVRIYFVSCFVKKIKVKTSCLELVITGVPPSLDLAAGMINYKV